MMRRKHTTKIVAVIAFLMTTIPLAQVARANRPSPMLRTRVAQTKFGKASWYSKRSPGIRRRTANNEVFDDQAMTCAMWGVRFNQKLRVTNVENGKSIIVRVNDRGPHKRLVHRGRLVDLTKRAFEYLDTTQKGLINVKIEFL